MTTPMWALIAVFAPLASALLLAVLAPIRRRGGLAAAVSITFALASLVGAIFAVIGTLHAGGSDWTRSWLASGGALPLSVTFGVHVDGVSAPMLAVVALVATCVQLFSTGYLDDESSASRGRYFAYQSLFLFSMQLLVAAPNLLQLFFGWEIVGATSYLLIGYWYKKPSAARAAVKAFWVTKFADMGLLIGLVALFGFTGSFEWTAQLAPAAATAVTLLFVLAVMGKSAQFPLHVWLPDAMEGPTPVSALLHAATMVAAGVYLVVRAQPLFAQAPFTQHFLAYLGAGTALFAALLALVQTDLKRVLAYSTCSQLGYMLAALGAGSAFAGFFHLTTHAFFKALLFLAAGSVIHAVGSNEMSKMGGLWKKMPLTMLVFIAGAFSLAGFPGFAGFFSKDLIIDSLSEHHLWAPYAALLLGAFLTALYMGRAILLTFFGPHESHEAEHAHEPGWSMKLPLIVLALLSVGAGFFGGDLWHLASLTDYVHGVYHFRFGAVASVLALSGFVVAWVAWGKTREEPALARSLAAFANRAWVDRLYVFGYRAGLLLVSDVAAWIDRYIVDALVNVVGSFFLLGARRARRLQTGNVQDYLFAMSLGAIALAVWSIWR